MSELSSKPNRSFLVVVNPLPNKQREQRLAQLIVALDSSGFRWQLYNTQASFDDNLSYFISLSPVYSDIIIVGGDGTFHNVINCLLHPDCQNKYKGADIGLLPAGTGNDFARTWYGPNYKIADVIRVVLAKRQQAITLGRCQFVDENGLAQDKYFHNVMGLGFDAALAKSLRYSKGRFQSLGYLLKAVRHIPFYQEQDCQFHCGSEVHSYKNLITVFANSQYFGGGLKVAPHAHPTAGSLDICRVGQYPLLTKLSLIVMLCFGKHLKSNKVDYNAESKSVEITSSGLDIEADGEYLGISPCRVSHVKQALQLKY